MFRRYVLPALVYLFYRSLRMTWRITLDECPSFQQALKNREPGIFAHWHGDELGRLEIPGVDSAHPGQYGQLVLAFQTQANGIGSGLGQ